MTIHSLFRSLFVASALAASACASDLPHDPPPASVATAVFDPTVARIPLPNDLAFLNPPNSVCPAPDNEVLTGPPRCAQAELLDTLKGQFPSDQEVAVTIDFTQTNINGGSTETVAPDLDLASFTRDTFLVYGATATGMGRIEVDPLTAADYVKNDDGSGTLSIHNKGRAPWLPGTYAVFVRGGESGVTTASGSPVYASQVFYLLAQGRDMTDPANLGLLRAQLGSLAAAREQGAQLNALIALYKGTAYPIVDTVFPHEELAILTTFHIGATVTNVTIDPGRGLVPLPIDLLRDPRPAPAGGRLTALAACTLAGSQLAANGSCPSPLAAGFQALDGFSTTGAILAPTSDLVQAATVTKDSLLLFDLSDPANPVQVDPNTLIIEPCEFTSACGSATALSPVIAIQPAGATAVDPVGSAPSVFRTRPLKDATDYAVVMTNAIHDKASNPIGPGTVAKIVRFNNPILVGGKSGLSGIDDGTAAALEKMRLQLKPVFAKLATAGTDATKVAMAYTFRTQTIASQAVSLAALPYIRAAATGAPGAVNALTPAAAFAKYGVPGNIPSSNIDEILEVDITTFNALDPTTGAFVADLASAPTTAGTEERIHVLIATPKADNASIPTCQGDLGPLGKCAPMMVFRHGFRRGRADMLLIADTYAAAGMITVAIDAAKHGDRSFCTSGTTGAASGCNGGAACTTTLQPGAQGDVSPPGTCGDAGLAKLPVVTGVTGATDGIAATSGNYLVSANFFRTRDTMRQDAIDQSQLIRALAVPPPGTPPNTGHTVFDHIFTRSLPTGHGLVIDPTTIYFSGQSLGAIQGAIDVASNPRISKAAFNVGGGTLVDVFTNSEAFAPATNQLLAGLGITRGTSQFLQFLVVAKTVLDPADPINFVGHLKANTLPNLLPPVGGNPDGTVPQAPKAVLTQVAHCDTVVPNPFNYLYSANAGVSPLLIQAGFGGPGTFQLFVSNASVPPAANCTGVTPVSHGFLLDWSKAPLASKAQSDIANFMMSNTIPLGLQQ